MAMPYCTVASVPTFALEVKVVIMQHLYHVTTDVMYDIIPDAMRRHKSGELQLRVTFTSHFLTCDFELQP
ncbi:UNVERIFIED_CONTAM: hypothetical protein FKN15_037459 [Acipenser sinensis]